jgi:hypothetical protein
MTRDEEILAIALWVERTQGADGPLWITEQIGRMALDGDPGGIACWQAVARAWQGLQDGPRQ